MIRHIIKFVWPVIVLAVISTFPSCDKDKNHDDIPFAYVDITIFPNSTLWFNLNTPGGWEYLTAYEPSRGIIVYRMTMDEFMAYERTCPYDPLDPYSRIEVDASHITASCPVCGSSYLLLDGSPFKGPAQTTKRFLKRYRTMYNGNTLRIFN